MPAYANIFSGDLVQIDGTNTIGIATAEQRCDVPGTDGKVRQLEHRIVYRQGRRWVKQWIPERHLTKLTPAYDIPLGKAYDHSRNVAANSRC